MVAKWEGYVGGIDWEYEINRCKLLYIEWINNRVLLYSTGNNIQYPVINKIMKRMKRIYMYNRITLINSRNEHTENK